MAKNKKHSLAEEMKEIPPAKEVDVVDDSSASEDLAVQRAQLEEERVRLEALRAELESAKAAPSASSEQEDLVNELRRMKGELQIALDAARKQAGLDIPATQPIDPKTLIPVPLPDGQKTAPSGSVQKIFRVTLQHCGTQLIQLWEAPGTGFASRNRAVEAFNRFYGIISSDHAHSVEEVTGPEALVAPTMPFTPPVTSTLKPAESPLGIETGAVRDPGLASLMAGIAAAESYGQ